MFFTDLTPLPGLTSELLGKMLKLGAAIERCMPGRKARGEDLRDLLGMGQR